jgi:hypothetical protein
MCKQVCGKFSAHGTDAQVVGAIRMKGGGGGADNHFYHGVQLSCLQRFNTRQRNSCTGVSDIRLHDFRKGKSGCHSSLHVIG